MAGNKHTFVLDASVILKWFLVEAEDQQGALDIKKDFERGKITIALPTHAFFEICNVLAFKKPVYALSAYSALLEMGFEEYALSVKVAAKVFDIVRKHPKISFYDAAYHALAMQLDAIFLTADLDYFKKTRQQGAIALAKDYAGQ